MRAVALAFALFAAGPLTAQVPDVVTDIAPIQSLAAIVLGDLGQPRLLLDSTADPHDFQMRPSQARALSRADLVIWMGPALTPWLTDALATLAPDARALALLDAPNPPLRIEGGTVFQQPASALFRTTADAVVMEFNRPDVAELPDPHAWLDPATGAHYLNLIAAELAAADPLHADIYAANATATILRLKALDAELRVRLDAVRGATLVAYHDAFGYFLARYDLTLAGFLSATDGTPPGAARLAALRAEMARAAAGCILTEPGTNPALIDSLRPGPGYQIVQLDPLGAGLANGAGLYETMILGIADALATCAPP